MFEVGFFELVVIFGVALVVLGPKRLPGLVGKIGRWVGKARSMARQFREQLENEVNLEELNRMTEAAAKQPPKYPAPPPEFGGEPVSTSPAAGTEPAAGADVAQASTAGVRASSGPSGETDIYAPPDPGSTIPTGDPSHNDLSEPVHEPPKEPGNERAS